MTQVAATRIARDDRVAEVEFRELAVREAIGLTVRLCWRPSDDEVFVEVHDEVEGWDFVLNPPRRHASFAYWHPYAALLLLGPGILEGELIMRDPSLS